jgi:hypothetical protein
VSVSIFLQRASAWVLLEVARSGERTLTVFSRHVTSPSWCSYFQGAQMMFVLPTSPDCCDDQIKSYEFKKKTTCTIQDLNSQPYCGVVSRERTKKNRATESERYSEWCLYLLREV